MTPTKQEMQFFIDHQELFERLWKPVFGDLVLLWNGDKAEWGKDLWCVIGRFSEDTVDAIRESDGAIGAALIVDCALLPGQGQLQAMLEERTQYLETDNRGDREGYRYRVTFATTYLTSDRKIRSGPTPSIALGKALTEVLDEPVIAS